jgi:hypothetical protein
MGSINRRIVVQASLGIKERLYLKNNQSKKVSSGRPLASARSSVQTPVLPKINKYFSF